MNKSKINWMIKETHNLEINLKQNWIEQEYVNKKINIDLCKIANA